MLLYNMVVGRGIHHTTSIFNSILNRIEYIYIYTYINVESVVANRKKNLRRNKRGEWCKKEKKDEGSTTTTKWHPVGDSVRAGEMRNKTHGVCFLCRS